MLSNRKEDIENNVPLFLVNVITMNNRNAIQIVAKAFVPDINHPL